MSRHAHGILLRSILRSRELHDSASADPLIESAYETTLGSLADAYLASDARWQDARTASRVARAAMNAAVDSVERLHRTARAMAQAHVPSAPLPGTLKDEPTPTEKRDALSSLSSLVLAHHADPWAAAVQATGYVTLAAAATSALTASLIAEIELSRATSARAAAALTAYAAFLSFKDIVRQHCGKSSKEYRWIHPRPAAAASTADTSPVAAATNGAVVHVAA